MDNAQRDWLRTALFRIRFRPAVRQALPGDAASCAIRAAFLESEETSGPHRDAKVRQRHSKSWFMASGAVLGAWLAALAAAAPAAELRELIDQQIGAAWTRENIAPAGPADDATFLRRISLDLTGLISSQADAQAFLADATPDKRSRLIDRLLDSPRYGVHQGDVWDMVFFGRHPPGYDAPNRPGFQRWLSAAFSQNMPYDQIVRAMLRAEGNTVEQGAPMYLLQYERRPEDAAVAVSQTFLGIQLQCARCHDHPHEPWKQRDFYGLAAFFPRLVRVQAGKVENEDKLFVAERNVGEVKFTGPVKDAVPGQEGEAIKPKYLLGDTVEEPDLSAFKDEPWPKDGEPPAAPKFSRKDLLADWMVAPENRFFARAAANRIWAQFLGRGLVHPVDNMSDANPPSHPELLDALAQEFAAHKFDVKWLVREIVNSRTYQLAPSQAPASSETSQALPRWFERARSRPLSAEELVESWRIATGYDDWFATTGKTPEGRFHGLTWDYVKQFFGEPTNGVGDFQGGLHEHLYLNNGELGRLMVAEPGGLVHALSTSQEPWEARVDRLFLSVLSRPPTADERQAFVAHLSPEDQRSERLQEAMWVLLTCSEFRFNH